MSDIVRHCQCWLISLHGSLFWKFKDVILGYKCVSSFQEIFPPEVEEHVGNNDQQLLVRHNGVTRDVAIVSGKDSRKINVSRKDEFIKLNESS